MIIQGVKTGIKKSLYHLGYFDLIRKMFKKHIYILMYHRFSEQKEPFKIPVTEFEEQILFLKKKFTFIPLAHLSEIMDGEREDCPDNAIVLTIDDGYLDNYAFAYPVLRKHHIPATIFLTTDFVECKHWIWSNRLAYILKNSRKGMFTFPLWNEEKSFSVESFQNWHETQMTIFRYCRQLDNKDKDNLLEDLAKRLLVKVPEESVDDFLPLTWDQINEMCRSGIDFGSHTRTHPILSRVDEKTLQDEIGHSKTIIENKIQQTISGFCYPYGKGREISVKAIQAVRSCGYKSAVTTISGYNSLEHEDPFLLRRVSVISSDKRLLLEPLVNFNLKKQDPITIQQT